MPSLVEIGPVVLEKKILKLRQNVFTLLLQSPLGKGQGPSFDKLESPSPKDGLYQFLLKFVQWFWRRRRTCEKFPTTSTATTTPTTMMSTDNGQIVIRKALEPSAQVSLKACYCSWFYNLLNALTTG